MVFRQIAKALCVVVALTMCSATAHAALLGLTQKFPDITGGDCNVTYNSSNGHLDVNGFSEGYSLSGETPTVPSGADTSFSIHAILNPLNGAFLSGTITADGKLPSFGATSGLLLQGDLTAFGFLDGGGTLFQFLFHPTSGDLITNVAPNGVGGVILDMHGLGAPMGEIPFTGSFMSNFQNADPVNGGNGNADVFPAPEPASIGLICISSATLLLQRRRCRGRICRDSCS